MRSRNWKTSSPFRLVQQLNGFLQIYNPVKIRSDSLGMYQGYISITGITVPLVESLSVQIVSTRLKMVGPLEISTLSDKVEVTSNRVYTGRTNVFMLTLSIETLPLSSRIQHASFHPLPSREGQSLTQLYSTSLAESRANCSPCQPRVWLPTKNFFLLIIYKLFTDNQTF